MRRKIAILILLFFYGLTLLFFSVADVYAQKVGQNPGFSGIVPCGRNADDPSTTISEIAPCTLCHLILGFQKLVQYGLYMVITVGLVAIFFAGTMYVVSSGDEGMMNKAKGFLKAALIGFAFVLGAWLIISTTMWSLGKRTDPNELGVIPTGLSWWQFTCDTKSSAPYTPIKGDDPLFYGETCGSGGKCYGAAACPDGYHNIVDFGLCLERAISACCVAD